MEIMKKLFILLFWFIFGCSSDTPVNMDEVLFERGERFISMKNQKVYNGPGFKKYKNGEKQEQGTIKNGWRSETWTGWYEDGKKKFTGEYLEGKPHGSWNGFHRNGQKKYEGTYEVGFQIGKWTYYDRKGKKNLEEEYFVCTEECAASHPADRRGKKYICGNLGKITASEKF